MNYYAHTKEGCPENEWQTIREHSENVAKLCVEFSRAWCREEYAYNLGLLHDVGKYQSDFQRRIRNEAIQVEHAFCGAIESNRYRLFGLDYCISGHHSGLPDVGTRADTAEDATLLGKLKRKAQEYSAYREELALKTVGGAPFLFELSKDRLQAQKQLAFAIRMLFSALVDADYTDTETYCTGKAREGINADLLACKEKIYERLNAIPTDTAVRKARRNLLQQALSHKEENADVYLMNMPTGSGKTLSSMAFALEKAVSLGKKRIIYVIPYTSIIEQNAQVFKDLFGEDVVLEHHCNFDFDKIADVNTRKKLIAAAENWDAPIVVTTNVQFFQSIYGNKPSQMRKLHNIADSVIVFDEVHMFPALFYQPCLEAVKHLVKDYGCKALFLTATMPDFERWLKEFGCNGLTTCELIQDKSDFPVFERCDVEDIGAVSREKIAELANNDGATLIVVNTRKSARDLYETLSGEKYHLSTYMTKRDRNRVIHQVKEALRSGRNITLVSTSLIEAGVDLDFKNVFRERAGLDNILQASGRCNREGLREKATCKTIVFDFADAENGASRVDNLSVKRYICREVMEQFGTGIEGVEEYFNKLFTYCKTGMSAYDFKTAITSLGFQFQSYAEKFKLIDEDSVAVVIEYPDDRTEREIIQACTSEPKKAKRQLQQYAVSLRRYEMDKLMEQGVLVERDGIWFLENFRYYDVETGIKFSDEKDYIF